MKIDCHAHVIEPTRFPYSGVRSYKPKAGETGSALDYLSVLQANGIDGGLLVQPSCYGYDNSAMLDAMSKSRGAFKGIAVVGVDATSEEIAALKRQGVVGTRLNIGGLEPDFFRRPEAGAFLDACADADWFCEIFAIGDDWEAIAPIVAPSRATIIIDHIGHPDSARGLDQPGFQAVLSLAARRETFVKLSGFFRVSRQPWPHDNIEIFIRATIDAFGLDRCVWGSDWPFINTDQTVSYREQLACLSRWMPDAADRRKVLVENPSRLFGFPAA